MIKAIETEYKGYRFRSRLEARWAVFFDAAGIEWEYEPEGYDLGDGIWYLPDFWLPRLKIWVEVKGVKPTDGEELKCTRLALGGGKPVLIVGQIPEDVGRSEVGNEDQYFGYYFCTFVDPDSGTTLPGQDQPYLFCQCTFCGAMGCEFDGRSARISCCDKNSYGRQDKSYNANSHTLIQGYAKARQARFGR